MSIAEAGTYEHYDDPRIYDHEYRRRRRDLHFYCELADRVLGGPGHILELGCGSGRLTTMLLRRGHSVVGLDISLPMLIRARQRIDRLGAAKRSRANMLCADMRTFSLGRKFKLIVSAFNSVEHLYTRTDVEVCLARVRDHLEPGGRFIFDVQVPDLHWLCRDENRRWARTRFNHPTTGEPTYYTTNHTYDPVSQLALIRIYYTPVDAPERETTVHLTQRKFFPAELEALVAANGFTVERRFGDFAGAPLHDGAESQVLVCSVRR